MAQYIDAEELVQEVERVIDSNAKNLDVSPTTKEIYLLGMKHTLDFVKVTPPIDAVEVVRCKDCKYFTKERIADSIEYICAHRLGLGMVVVNPHKYCSDGERKKDNEQL